MNAIAIKSSMAFISQVHWDTTLRDLFPKDFPIALAVVDSNARWYFDQLMKEVGQSIPAYEFTQPDEGKKTWKTVRKIHDFLFSHNADRNTTLLALGGGVTLDVAGYAASIFKRGIQWIAIPTTLLAQVDASVGGKTAINDRVAKNAIGTFYPPSRVLINAAVSQSWNDDIRLEGLAEVYKILLAFSPRETPSLLQCPTPEHARKSILLKVQVVKIDPWEKNLRGVLNYGHTYGHAIEHSLHLPHGIAVSIGIRLENYVAVRKGIMSARTRERIEAELSALGFPRPDKLPRWRDLFRLMQQDKKNLGASVAMSLVSGERRIPMKQIDPRTRVTEEEARCAYDEYLKTP